MLCIPVVYKEIVKCQEQAYPNNGNEQHAVIHALKNTQAKEQATTDATLPPQEEATLRGASLAMATQLDEEQKKTGAYEAQS